MSENILTAEQVNTLIKSLLKQKDPASVGLKRILKEKNEEGKSFPYKRLRLNDFGPGASGDKIFDDNERDILRLEKKCRELEFELSDEKKKSVNAVKTAFEKGAQQGKKDGFAEGKKEAQADYETRLKEIEKKMASFISDVEVSRKKIIKDSGRELLELSFLIARKILNKKIDEDRDAVFSVIRKSLDYIAERGNMTVRVSPDDYENVSRKEEFWNSVGENLENINIKKDSRIEKGGCIIEAGSASADARIDLQLDEMREVVESAWNTSGSEDRESGEDMSLKTGEIAETENSAGAEPGVLKPEEQGDYQANLASVEPDSDSNKDKNRDTEN